MFGLPEISSELLEPPRSRVISQQGGRRAPLIRDFVREALREAVPAFGTGRVPSRPATP